MSQLYFDQKRASDPYALPDGESFYVDTAVFSDDPRGAVLKLVLPRTRRSNDFGGEGYYCVPS
jgi:hypothetical protein